MKQINEDIYQPSQFLADHIGLLPRGRTLDVAMGNGRNAIYLAKMGCDVEGIDISPEAIRSSLKAAEKSGVHIQARVCDLERNPTIEKDCYSLIVCFNYLQRSLILQIKEGLKKGGMVVYETFIIDQARFGKPKNPEFLLKHNELLRMFWDFRCLRYREGVIEGSMAISSIVAEKV